MSMSLTQKDWLLISAFLDGRLSDAENTALESRLTSDPDFKTAFLEIQYTRRLLRSLPPKRAPRNFTLSAEYAKKRSLKWGLNRFFGWASAASAVALAAIFAWSNLFVFQAKTAAPAPMLAVAPESANAESAALADETNSTAPMIITWGQQGRGGGGGSDSSAMATGLGGYGGGAPGVAEQKLATLVPTESPMVAADLAATPDPSTLILGLPEPGTEGETLQSYTSRATDTAPRMKPSSIWMIGLGAGALVFALLAIFLRKR
jgi:anti-sigma factor RsiW